MSIPPIVGLVVALLIGSLFGGSTVYLYLDSEQAEADNRQIEEDNELAGDITEETVEAKAGNTVTATIVKWRDRPPIKIPVELTDDEIDTICVNRNVPDDIMQSIRSEAAKARQRFNNLQF